MSLIQMTAQFFHSQVRSRGEKIYASRRVYATSTGPDHFYGQVQGGDLYDVRIKKTELGLEVWCDCIAFEDYGPCKHVWTAILEADRRGSLAAVKQVLYLQKEDTDYGVGTPPSQARYQPAPPPMPAWQEHLGDVERRLKAEAAERTRNRPKPSQMMYVIDVNSSIARCKLAIELFYRTRKKDGKWADPKEIHLSAAQVPQLSDPADVEIAASLLGGEDYYAYSNSSYFSAHRKVLNLPLSLKLIPLMASSGRLFYRELVTSQFLPADWDAGDPWIPSLALRQDERDQWTISGFLRRGDERMKLDEPLLLLADGLLLARGVVARFEPGESFGWVSQLREVKQIPFPDRDRDAVLAKLLQFPALPPMEIDEPLRFEQRQAPPRFGFRIRKDNAAYGPRYAAQFMLDYGTGWMDGMSQGHGIWRPDERVYLLRDHAAESAARDKLAGLGLRTDPYRPGFWLIAPKLLPRVARELIASGWHVEAEGKLFRSPGATRVSVKSGIDWFELHGEVQYGDTTASLPELLAAVRRGDSMVVLGDGTFGLLPEQWLQRFAPLAGMGEKHDDHLKFRQNQAALLDALLAAQPDVNFDQTFARIRERVRSFHGVENAPQPEGFSGQLRQYQLDGLGWMHFLREFGFGGCLADDMGVGKTAQVLATLEKRRAEGKGPSLVVVPKSVMFNWREESARFTPGLRVLEYHGIARDTQEIPRHDLVLTTYGTMLRDAAKLSKIVFDYVVLDEAQAVKNASTASAKAVRLLRGAHRLALSGTPVENHLGELWSLFEFLNPGMLGEARALEMAGGMAHNPSPEARQLLAHALRPFILRRTKQQVARELPEKTEQTIFCELEGPQRKHYEELRRHYRASLLDGARAEGLGRWKMHVLEALLRLRQAACHPGLLDPKRVDESSAKLDVLMAQLAEIREEGHKALVFSQFTSLLSIVRRRLDQDKVRYEYLDGATTNRQAHVETFQNDAGCGLFLISLKAGGLGLNLTAAEYVFLLDPWWNPAVEAQAVDRAHRIGQTRPVFAYRLIARDTVEEKVLQLQKTKRDLADAILSEDNSLIRDLKKEDLELLLS
ncbi:MAG TPA: DEAD/DEAH box helicase [Bryobacteraceae bacterium]|nr:DEAD/DEAH box helicase [Bryobacteraceae bacterium]